ncbi:hypothetical protein AMJ86_00430 [bacterium SM23_57]|nr:MAG: hypothetical protein AMJ86_00430 [bacterium SM23_57]
MRKNVLCLTIVLILVLTIASPYTTPKNRNSSFLITQAPLNSEIFSSVDVFEYCKSESRTISNAHNDTKFTFNSNWYPQNYYGYCLHATITDLRKTINPIPNGNFEQYPEPGNNWTVTQSTGLIKSNTTIPEGNPGSCYDLELANGKVLGIKTDYVDNDFEYISQFTPTILTLSFDIRFSADITKADWFIIRVEIEDQLNDSMGMWWESTSEFAPTTWTHSSFSTIPVNGTLTLRIALQKTDSSNLDVDGHIYFDNFEYQIGTYGSPSGVELTLNSTQVMDTFAANGEVDIFSDPILKEEINPSMGWNTNQTFLFSANDTITFDVQYTMHVKSESNESAISSFTVSSNSEPSWIINYTIPSDQPPPNYDNYQFGLYLPDEWNLLVVRNQIGYNITSYSYTATNRFLLMHENIGLPGDHFDIHCISIIQTEPVLDSPVPNGHYGWSLLFVNVSWLNLDLDTFVKNAEVILSYTDESNSTFTISMIQNGYGSYSMDVPIISHNSGSSISIAIEFFKYGYSNATSATGTALEFSVVVNTGIPPTFFGIPTEILILVIILLIFIFLSWILYSKVYNPRYVIPKREAHARKLQEVLEMFNDVTNLSRFLVLHHGSGIAIFDPFKDRGMDASLFGGFLQALQAFAIDVASNSDDSALPTEARLSEITYEGFRVIIHDGTYTRTALVYRGIPSDTLKEKIQTFAARFEERYSNQLEKRGFEPALFDGANDLLEEIFHVSLLFPHRVLAEVSKSLSLSFLENRLHYVALELAKSSEFVFLGEIMSSYLETVKEEPTELMNALFELREKKILIPSEVF